MAKNLFFLIVFGGLFIVQFSCKVTNDEDAVVDIDPVFNLEMVENLQKNRELSFWVRSIELQECENFTISHSVTRTTSEINIALNDIIAPSDCIVGEMPAISEIKLGELPLARTYNTEFTIKNTITNQAKLIIQPDVYLLELESMDGFGSVVQKLYKIPANLIWGYVAFNDENVVGNIPTDFLAELTGFSNPKILQAGNYGHFEIKENNALELLQSSGFQKVVPFYFNYFSDRQALADLVENYRSTNNANEISFKILTADGEEF